MAVHEFNAEKRATGNVSATEYRITHREALIR